MSSRRMIWVHRVGVGACPLMALVGVRLWLASDGPATAAASTPAESIVRPEYVRLPEASESQRNMLERARSLEGVEPSSPFPQSEVRLIGVPDIPALPGEPAPVVEPPPELTLTSIMGGRVPVAMVDGRPRSLGDLVAPSWSIVAIKQDCIVVEHPDGRQVTVNLQRGTP